MNLLNVIPYERRLRFLNHITGTLSEEIDLYFDYDPATRERIATGRMCRCGDCTCCKTKQQADEHDSTLLALNGIKSR